jgi:hypothetical protein
VWGQFFRSAFQARGAVQSFLGCRTWRGEARKSTDLQRAHHFIQQGRLSRGLKANLARQVDFLKAMPRPEPSALHRWTGAIESCFSGFCDSCAGTRVTQNRLERFSNSCALAGIAQGGFFLRKTPLKGSGFGVQQLENRCNREQTICMRLRFSTCRGLVLRFVRAVVQSRPGMAWLRIPRHLCPDSERPSSRARSDGRLLPLKRERQALQS